MEHNKTENLVKQLIDIKKKHGPAKLKEFFEVLDQAGSVNKLDGECSEIQPPGGCGTGYYWSETLCRCVLEIGK